MTRTIEKVIDIAAPPEAVWEVLTDVQRYHEWNPFIVAGEGEFRAGQRVTLKMRAARKNFRLRPRIVERKEEQLLRWSGSLGVRGIFDGDHVHELTRTPSGTRYTQRESFSGILVPLLGKTLAATAAAFEDMNVALKRRAEAEVVA